MNVRYIRRGRVIVHSENSATPQFCCITTIPLMQSKNITLRFANLRAT